MASHPIQYQAGLWRTLSLSGWFDVEVMFCWDPTGYVDRGFGRVVDWGIPLLNGYRYRFLRNISPRPGPWFFGEINPGVVRWMRRARYDAVLIHGYTWATCWLAAIAAAASGVSVILRGEASLLETSSRTKAAVKRLVLPRFLRLCDAVLYSCSENRRYFRHYGVPDEKLFFFPCAVDNDYWQTWRRRLSGRRSTLRREWGIEEGALVFIFAGKLIERNCPADIIRAFANVCRGHQTACLLVAGDGPLRPRLEAMASDLGCGAVRFLGLLDQKQMARLFSVADIYVICSARDPSPKVLNEAMNFALPVVASDSVGTAHNLVVPGRNGFIYPTGDVAALTGCLERLAGDRILRERMGYESEHIVRGWSFQQDAEGLKVAVEYCLARRDK